MYFLCPRFFSIPKKKLDGASISVICCTRDWTSAPCTLVSSSRLTTRRKVHEGPVQCGLGSSRGRGPRRPNPWTKTLAIGTWNVTSLGGKEPELVREVERYRLEIVGLTSTHSLGSGTQLLERGWTLHYSGVAQGELGGELVWACL
ncbi:hypothetical protein L3Q82_000425 [Scortum barcoo]|uniref:Uncharacterized protein n=1 Tax=Scortum barcoo TaxID=214431 RepID=A0ACB8WF11_9TELE|nr:hypothetical protein L3Q82_000425 [Scortum barcoo]